MRRVLEGYLKLTATNHVEGYRFKRQSDWVRFASALRTVGLPEGGTQSQ